MMTIKDIDDGVIMCDYLEDIISSSWIGAFFAFFGPAS